MTSLVNKVSIRALARHDLDLVTVIWTSSVVREYLGGPISLEKASERLSQMLKLNGSTAWFFVVEYAGEKAGVISIDHYHESDDHEISYQFLPEFWGRGVAFASIKQVMNFARSAGIAGLIAETQMQNSRSNKLLLKLGMIEKNVLNVLALSRLFIHANSAETGKFYKPVLK